MKNLIFFVSVTAMYAGLSEALPPTKNCNIGMIEVQNKLGSGQNLGYVCDKYTEGRHSILNGTLKFNEKYVYRDEANVPKWSCFLIKGVINYPLKKKDSLIIH